MKEEKAFLREVPYRTQIVKIDRESPNLSNHADIIEASRLIREGELVAFPTETVYGLGGDGLNTGACEKIFIAKGRPQDNPLILHVSNFEMVEALIEEKDKFQAYRPVLEMLWPGPLTVIFKRSGEVPDVVTAGGPTVAIRMPKNNLALALIEKSGRPLAGPSANRSGRPSPTEAEDVYEDLKGRIPYIIDGGSSEIGIESTVLDLSSSEPAILRPGFYTREFLIEYFPGVDYDRALLKEGMIPRSPGQKYRHYAPRAQMEILVGSPDRVDEVLETEIEKAKLEGVRLGLLLFEENRKPEGVADLIFQGSLYNLQEMSHSLFHNLREFDRRGVDKIFAVGLQETSGFEISIMNRMKKSASNRLRFCD